VADDVILAKIATIERCLERIREEYGGRPDRLDDYRTEEMIVLNLQRACEASIDIAMRIVARRRLGFPQESRQTFELLEPIGVLSASLTERMKHMVGFRNVAVHDYTKLNKQILLSILDKNLVDFDEFCRAVVDA
jgi:uncharacterized protein YutE (UPF0331/DUF86 family)